MLKSSTNEKKLLEALVSLVNNPDFKIYTEWLTENEAMLSKDNYFTPEETQLRWKQGALQTLSDIQNKIRSAYENLQNLKTEKKGRSPAF